MQFKLILKHVCYNEPGNVKSIHIKYTDELSNVSPLSQDRRVFRIGFGSSVSKALLHSQQKNMLWIRDVIR